MSKILRIGDSSTLFMSSDSQQEHAQTYLHMLQMSSACGISVGALLSWFLYAATIICSLMGALVSPL